MSNATLTNRNRRITVEMTPELVVAIETAAQERSTPYRKLTMSDVVREAVVRFLLPESGTNRSHIGTNATTGHSSQGSNG